MEGRAGAGGKGWREVQLREGVQGREGRGGGKGKEERGWREG